MLSKEGACDEIFTYVVLVMEIIAIELRSLN